MMPNKTPRTIPTTAFHFGITSCFFGTGGRLSKLLSLNETPFLWKIAKIKVKIPKAWNNAENTVASHSEKAATQIIFSPEKAKSRPSPIVIPAKTQIKTIAAILLNCV